MTVCGCMVQQRSIPMLAKVLHFCCVTVFHCMPATADSGATSALGC